MDNKIGTVTNFTPFLHPIPATIDGKLIDLCAYGDVTGNSPSFLTYDSTTKRSRWLSFDEVEFGDATHLPMFVNALRNLKVTAGSPK